jgi:YVTN family beta-propeller protein
MNPLHANRNTALSFAAAASMILSVWCAAPGQAQQPTLAYVTNTTSNAVQVVNLDTGDILAAIPVGAIPVDIDASPDSQYLYVSNRGTNDVSVISPAQNAVVATITVGSAPEGIALSPDGATLYVANTYGNSLSVVDTASRSVRATIGVGHFPGHIAVAPNPSGNPIYVTCRSDDTVAVVDTSSLTVTRTIAAGHTPWSISLRPGGDLAYVSNINAGTVSVIATDPLYSSGGVLGRLKVGNGAWSVLRNPEWGTHTLYVTNSDDGTLSVLSSWWGGFQRQQDFQVGSANSTGPYGMAITPLGNSLVVPNYGNGTLNIYKIKNTSARPTGSISLGGTPMAVATIGGDK